MRRFAPYAALVLIGLLVPVSACTGSAPAPTKAITVYPVADRAAAPAMVADLLDGTGTFDLAGHAGEVVVVNFWASWCAPCVSERDDLEATYQATRTGKVIFVGVNTRDDRDGAKAFVATRVSYPSVFDPAGKLALGFSVPPTSIPSTIVIDRQGRVAAIAFGAVVRTDLEPVVTDVAAESS